MPTFEQHCNECVEKLGKPYEEVHKWLDEFMNADFLPLLKKTRHRQFRHHQAGMEEIRKLFGDDAVKAAEIHIRADLASDNYPEHNPLPLDKEHFERLQLW